MNIFLLSYFLKALPSFLFKKLISCSPFPFKNISYLPLCRLGGNDIEPKYAGILTIFYFFRIKSILLFFICIYLIILCFCYYLLFKGYQSAIEYVNSKKVIELNKDIINLVTAHPFNVSTGLNLRASSPVYYPPSKIGEIYYIHGINHFKDFVYPSTPDMISLHTILESNHSVSSKFSSMIIQDVIREHTNTVTDITSTIFKKIFKLSIPLIGSLAILCTLSLLDSNSGQMVTYLVT